LLVNANFLLAHLNLEAEASGKDDMYSPLVVYSAVKLAVALVASIHEAAAA
jgi:hypothetical protein